MKKITAIITAILLIMTLFVSAQAEEAQEAVYANTKAFLKELDDLSISYYIDGIDEDSDEWIEIDNEGDNCYYTINLFFTEDNETVFIRVWDIISFDEANYYKVLLAANTVNSEYNFLKFYVDSDLTLTASMDLVVREDETTADIVLEALVRVARIVDEAYPLFSAYAK